MASGTALRPDSKSPTKNVVDASERSRYMECAVCLEVVFSKNNPRDCVFGILPNCNHCFCLACIRAWRNIKPPFKNSKACPVCRIESSFYVHSDYWLEDQDKVNLIRKYKDYMATKPCRYYAKGRGQCHFGLKCLYKHGRPKIDRLQTTQTFSAFDYQRPHLEFTPFTDSTSVGDSLSIAFALSRWMVGR